MRVPFTTMGSGSLAATSILETGYKDDMTQEEGRLNFSNYERNKKLNTNLKYKYKKQEQL